MRALASLTAIESPFVLENARIYARWREAKLVDYPAHVGDIVATLGDPRTPTVDELRQVIQICAKTNMAIYRSSVGSVADKHLVSVLAQHLGLTQLTSNLLADDDGISALQVSPEKSQRGYIPYSAKRLSWHTDGYYHAPADAIRAFVLHCVAPAANGGENALIDPEMIYIHLRERDPEYVRALMAPDAMTIPANTENAEAVRGASIGPVFAIDALGNLQMRYTARTRSIVWKSDGVTAAAVEALGALLHDDAPYAFHYRLRAGEGIVCNNVVHNRTAFSDDDPGKGRLLYRARYYDRIAGTDVGAALNVGTT